MQTLTNFRAQAEEYEEKYLHPMAALSRNHERYRGAEDDYRLPYKRDVDRIIHSKAYSRYIDKTQVAYLVGNDHITYRSLHVQLVSAFARGIAQILRLNVDLVEAISLGHDVGHPPFAHEGEGYLSEISQEYGAGYFTHPWQSCRLLSEIEPLNLGLNVLDGFLCHDGGMCGPILKPQYGKTWENHFIDKKRKIEFPEENIWPGTLEGCLVKLCDTMSYIGRDIEDAIRLEILKRESVPKTLLGTSNREILHKLASDIISHSVDKDYIAISEESYDALRVLRNFNFSHIYSHPKLKSESDKIRRGYRILFDYIMNDLEKKEESSYIWRVYLHNKPESYLKSTPSVQKVVDFISGMTDGYFIKTLETLLVPQRIET